MTIMEFWTIEVYDVGFLVCVAIVVVRSILGDDKEVGKFYQVDTLRVLVMVTFRVWGLERVTQWLFH